MASSDILRNFAFRAKQKLLGTQKREKPKVKIVNFDDDAFKEKVEFVMDRDDEIFNPMQYLVDPKVIKSLKGVALERYIFEVLDKYNYYKNEIELERSC